MRADGLALVAKAPLPAFGRPAVPTSAVWGEAQQDARAFGSPRDPLPLLGAMLALADAASVAGGSSAAHAVRPGLSCLSVDVATMGVVGAVLTMTMLHLSGAYARRIRGTLVQHWRQAMTSWTAALGMLLLAGHLSTPAGGCSAAWAILWWGGSLAGLLVARCAAVGSLRRLRARGRLTRTVAIVDLCEQGGAVARRLRAEAGREARLVGVFRPSDEAGGPDGVGELLALSRLFRVDEVVVLVASAAPSALRPVLDLLSAIPADVRVCPASTEVSELGVRDVGMRLGMPALTVQRKPFSGVDRDVKRLEDLLLSALAVAVLAPLMLVIAALVRIGSPGPAVFRQARQGFNNNVFTMFKFRTMTEHAQSETRLMQATRDDQRVTRLGRLLRRTSLDELPQLFNVLRGEMSLVGPRPHAVAHNRLYESLVDGYIARHKVKPGITGWAQVHGLRGETDTLDKMRRRVQFDLHYIESWSMLLDLRIIARTCLTALFDRRAY